MSEVALTLHISVGVLVERRNVASTWIDVAWRPVEVLAGLPEAAPWTRVSTSQAATIFYAGAKEVALYRSEVDNYRRNLETGTPALWVALHPTASEPPYAVAVVTADPAEGEALAEAGQVIVEAVAMPARVREAVAAFVEVHPGGRIFVKRKRDDAEAKAFAPGGLESEIDDDG